jgi:hypothetical protein
MDDTFSYMNNPTWDEPMHNNIMAKHLEDTKQGTPTQGDSHDFPFFVNVGSPLMEILNIPGLNFVLLVWLWTTLNVPNTLNASNIRTLCHGN